MDYIYKVYEIFNLEVKIIPVISIYLIWLFIVKSREQVKIKYTPIYCSLPVFQNSRRLQEFYITNMNASNQEILKVKKDCMKSFVIDSTIIPILLGVVLGFFNVSKETFYSALVLIILKRLFQFTICFFKIKKEATLAIKWNIRLVIFYFAFICSFIIFMNNSYTLTSKDIVLGIGHYMEEVKKIIFNYVIGWIGIPTEILSPPTPIIQGELVLNEHLEE